MNITSSFTDEQLLVLDAFSLDHMEAHLANQASIVRPIVTVLELTLSILEFIVVHT